MFNDYGTTFLFIEALAVPTADSMWRIDVNVNYANAMLVFTGTEKIKTAIPELFCEVKRTSDGHTVARASHIDTIRSASPLSKALTEHATFSFPASRRGAYTVSLDFVGPSVKYVNREQRRFLVIPEEKNDSITVAGVTVCYPASDSLEYNRVPYGGNFPFGVDAMCLAPFKEHVDSVGWELSKIKGEDETYETYKRGSSADVVPGALIQQSKSYSIVPAADLFVARIPLSNTLLEPGKYQLIIKAYHGMRRGTFSKNISVTWGEMPVSLSNLEFALEALSYITTHEEKDYLESGNETEMRKKFEEFWHKRDPTPATPYNEYFAEYYKRVDYVYFNFATLSEENGVKTDRGKVYILFGPPSATERVFSPAGAPEELWTYTNNVARKFLFLDKSRDGNYKLVSEEKQK